MGDTAKLIERLRRIADFNYMPDHIALVEAADALATSESTVAAMRAEVERLTKALEKIASSGGGGCQGHFDCVSIAARALDRSPSVGSGNG